MPLTVVILAAGQGKRMNSDLPKVLQPLAGQPLLQHVIRTARLLTPANICVVYGYGGAQVQDALKHEDVDWVLQAEQLGTGHAVMQAMSLIPDEHTVLVLYGDVPLIGAASLKKLIDLAAGGALAVLSVDLDDATGYGRIVRDARGQVSAIVEHKDASAAQLAVREVNTGLMAAPAGLLREWLLGLGRDNSQREYYLTDVVALAVRDKHRVEALPGTNPDEVLGVNDKVQLAEVEAHYRKACARNLMLAGATLADPSRIDIRGDIEVERDVYIDVNAVLIGKVHLGTRVKIGPNCVIRNARIGADTEVFANTMIDNAVIGEHCRIGPFARLRPETVLHRGVHIGNFVEIKNSEIGPGSKANHLSYVGDTRVGKRRQHRRRQHHLQLRRRQQMAHGHRGRRLHRLGQHARRAGPHRRRCHHRRGIHHHRPGARGQAHADARRPDHVRHLDAARQAVPRRACGGGGAGTWSPKK